MDLLNVSVLIGAFLGVVAPALFSALLILSVQRNADVMVKEIRRQFEENPKILTGEEISDFEKCIDIATKALPMSANPRVCRSREKCFNKMWDEYVRLRQSIGAPVARRV